MNKPRFEITRFRAVVGDPGPSIPNALHPELLSRLVALNRDVISVTNQRRAVHGRVV